MRPMRRWYYALLTLSDCRLKYGAGSLRRIANDSPADLADWLIVVFRVPPNRFKGEPLGSTVDGRRVSRSRAQVSGVRGGNVRSSSVRNSSVRSGSVRSSSARAIGHSALRKQRPGVVDEKSAQATFKIVLESSEKLHYDATSMLAL